MLPGLETVEAGGAGLQPRCGGWGTGVDVVKGQLQLPLSSSHVLPNRDGAKSRQILLFSKSSCEIS